MMCMANENIPPQLHFNILNPMMNIDGLGIIPTECVPWKGYGGDNKLLAGVSSFGFGGSNVHALVEKYRPAEQSPYGGVERPLHVFSISRHTATAGALQELTKKYVAFLGATQECLENICYTDGTGRQYVYSSRDQNLKKNNFGANGESRH
jgi:acyl transferase domain-containing protein